MTTTICINRDGVEEAVEVEFDYSRPCRGTCDRYGVPLEPDYPASMEFIGSSIGLNEFEIDQARVQAMEEMENVRSQF